MFMNDGLFPNLASSHIIRNIYALPDYEILLILSSLR